MFLDSWWIGVGPGNQAFRLAYGLYMISGFDALGTYCVPLEILVECGIGGLLVFALIVLAAMSRAHLMFWQAKEASEKIMSLGLSAAIFGMMVHGLVDTVFYRPQVQFIFWIVLASIICLRKISLQREFERS
jgi:putative inorganic carbon (HCO3(-)) transporter